MLFDPRVGQSEVSLYTAHQGAVLALSMFGNFIVSASEDHTLAVWDRRAEKVLKQLKLYANKVRVLQSGCYKLAYKHEINIWCYWVCGLFPPSSIPNRTHFRIGCFLNMLCLAY
jgi:WD40 repeat protein